MEQLRRGVPQADVQELRLEQRAGGDYLHAGACALLRDDGVRLRAVQIPLQGCALRDGHPDDARARADGHHPAVHAVLQLGLAQQRVLSAAGGTVVLGLRAQRRVLHLPLPAVLLRDALRDGGSRPRGRLRANPHLPAHYAADEPIVAVSMHGALHRLALERLLRAGGLLQLCLAARNPSSAQFGVFSRRSSCRCTGHTRRIHCVFYTAHPC